MNSTIWRKGVRFNLVLVGLHLVLKTRRFSFMKKKSIPIFFATDDNYARFLNVTLESLIENASNDYNYDIYVMNDGLSMSSRRSIKRFEEEGFKIHFVNVDSKLQALKLKLNIRDYYTMTTYYRLLLPELYPNLKKVLYLDCDIVLKDDVSKLFNVDISEHLVGAIRDQSVPLFKEFSEYVELALGIRREDYFNAGVLLMNLKKMRKERFLKRCMDLITNFEFKVAQDQDILNVITNGKVKYIPGVWNTMPLGERMEHPSLIHYNLIFKPWKQDDVMYEEFFWEYAKRGELLDELVAYKKEISDEEKAREREGIENVRKLCVHETLKADTYYKLLPTKMDEFGMPIKITGYRQEVLNKIKELEIEGKFDQDVEEDPPFVPLKPGVVDYEKKKLMSKIKANWANRYSWRFFNKLIKKGAIVIDGYEGLEYLKSVKSGAVITANHFNPFDSVPLHKVVKKNVKRKKLWKIIKEGNWSFPGLFGHFMRNCNTLPLAANYDVMKEMMRAVDKLLKKGDFLLVYAEQSMWWNYRKPKPLKPGAFSFAVKNNVPVIPTFITMRDTEKLDKDGLKIQAYTLHILEPIYPDTSLSYKENIKMMMDKNAAAWKETYEESYGIPLMYETKGE